MRSWQTAYLEMIKECKDNLDHLTDWESDFWAP